MRRVIMLILAGMGLSMTGCTFFQDTNPEPAWNYHRWQDMKEQNAQRLAGEDKQQQSVIWGALWAIPDAIGTGVTKGWDYLWGNTPKQWVKDLFGKDADRRREAIFKFDDQKFGRMAPYTRVLCPPGGG